MYPTKAVASLFTLVCMVTLLEGLIVIWSPVAIPLEIGIDIPDECHANVELFNSWTGFARINFSLVFLGAASFMCLDDSFFSSRAKQLRIGVYLTGLLILVRIIDCAGLAIGYFFNSTVPALLASLVFHIFAIALMVILWFFLWREMTLEERDSWIF